MFKNPEIATLVEVMIGKVIRYPVAVITVFIWIGFVCSISFMEAWLKFLPENVTLPVGLSIGRLIFGALNKVEWFLAALTAVHIFVNRSSMRIKRLIFFIIPILILTIQTIFLLPALNNRVDMVLIGRELSPSFIHFYYVIMEAVKVGCLFSFGVLCIQDLIRMGPDRLNGKLL